MIARSKEQKAQKAKMKEEQDGEGADKKDKKAYKFKDVSAKRWFGRTDEVKEKQQTFEVEHKSMMDEEGKRRKDVSRVDPMDLSEIGTLTGEMEEWMFARLVQGTVKLSNGKQSVLKLPTKLKYKYPHIVHLDLSW